MIVHPSHDPASLAPSPKDGAGQMVKENGAAAKSRMIVDACIGLGVSVEEYHIL
jgi:hypothetical protein